MINLRTTNNAVNTTSDICARSTTERLKNTALEAYARSDKGTTTRVIPGTSFRASVKLAGGNTLTAYADYTNSEIVGKFTIASPAGELMVDATTFNVGRTDYLSATELPDGNVLIAYVDDTNCRDAGAFVIVSPVGEIVGTPTPFNEARGSYVSSTTLLGGNVVITHCDDLDEGVGTFSIFDPTDRVVVDKAIFSKSCDGRVTTTALPNGNALIQYRGLGNINPFGYVTVSPTGEILTDLSAS